MTKKTVLGMPSCYFYADQLIAIGSVILIAGMFNEFINSWLKIVGCRPRYRYLITLEDPASEYKN